MILRKIQSIPFVTMVFILWLTGCTKHEVKDPRTEPELVRITTVQSAGQAESSFTGVVTARVQSDLGFRVPGKVLQRLVDVGQAVRQGQPLMRIDITDFSNTIHSRDQDVAAAKARADQAVADEARYRGLVATGAVAASTYDQVKAAADAARAQLAAADAQASIAKDEGAYTLLVADADGIVVETLAEPGQVVAAGQTVVKLAHAGPREAAVDLPETLRPALRSSARAKLYGATQDTPAYLRQLSDSADLRTRTFEARYVLGGADAKAPLGATVTIKLPEGKNAAVYQVPVGAIIQRDKGPGVWILKSASSTVSFRPVTILRLTEENAILSAGVQPGEEVVALGAHLLNEGDKVRVDQEEEATR